MIAIENLAARRPPLALARVTCSLGVGLHALLGAPTEGGPLLLAVLAGREAVRGGSVRVNDRAPGDPTTARAIAYVPMAPPLPDALTVRETLVVAARIRGEEADADARLAELGIGSLAPRRVRSLAPEEARAVAIAEALTSATTSVVLIDEPFVGVDPRATNAIRDHLRARAKRACVVVATASPSDAAALATSVLVFARGALVRQEAARALAAVAPGPACVRVVASDPRALLAELSREPNVRDLETRDAAILARGDDGAELAAAVTRAIARARVDVVEMRTELPPVEVLQAAASGAAAAAYQSALTRARPVPPPPPRQEPA